MWGEAAKDSYYPINIPDYASNILGPRRTFYTNKNRADRELLASNVKVRRAYYTILSHKFKDKSKENDRQSDKSALTIIVEKIFWL